MYLQSRTVRSRPLDTIWVGERNFAALTKDSCPPSEVESEVARMLEDVSHILRQVS